MCRHLSRILMLPSGLVYWLYGLHMLVGDRSYMFYFSCELGFSTFQVSRPEDYKKSPDSKKIFVYFFRYRINLSTLVSKLKLLSFCIFFSYFICPVSMFEI
ncbi:hypothetical protein SAY87_019273 [Trapa incisa]|uniref:Uncharacterized protein n=1 Tax=Trapa incisa TaxID=236973 RepID=A0AAN7K4L8_9MYRT|nr:hypothetical protein SAY87_019273 [Trapa incisa]